MRRTSLAGFGRGARRAIVVSAWAAMVSAAALSGVARARRAEDGPLVKLLKSGRVPAARRGAVIEMIGKRGSAADLAYIYEQATAGGLPAAARAKALEALAEAALTRGLRPEHDRDKIIQLFHQASPPDQTLALAAVRLAGLWRLGAAAGPLREIAGAAKIDEDLRSGAIESLAMIGGAAGRARIEELAGPASPPPVRARAIAALARLDVDAAAARAAEMIEHAASAPDELKPLMTAFANRRHAGAALAAALQRRAVPPDAAKLALHAAYSLGLADPALIETLGRAAGIATTAKPPTPAEIQSLVAEVAAKGDPARGESVFRRADLNCTSCHSINKAGGEVGPDLGAIGQSSPPDYIINAILVPDQSIKEQYHTLVVLTNDGQVYQGIITDKDQQKIVLKESTGALRTVPVSTIEDQKPGGSLMPKGLVNLMTRSEFVDLVRFLSELGRPGPYAIPTRSSVRRWRVLKTVPPALQSETPAAEVLRDQIVNSPADHWATVYARTSGALRFADLGPAAKAKVLYVQGELNVTMGGQVRVCPDSPEGIRYWVDEIPAPAGTREFSAQVMPGRHTVTVRVEPEHRPSGQLRIDVDKPNDSPAEFTIVGGQ